MGRIFIKIKTLTTVKTAQFKGLFEKLNGSKKYFKFYDKNKCRKFKNSDGRRITILPSSRCKKGDYNCFNLRSKCFNLKVARVFYNDMISLGIKNYYAQKHFLIQKMKY